MGVTVSAKRQLPFFKARSDVPRMKQYFRDATETTPVKRDFAGNDIWNRNATC